MCGIVGFTGTQQAAPILLNGLSKLEYRGYDSAGIAVRDGERLAQVVKAKGRLSNLIEKTDEGKALIGTCGIGHTRWATHGEPSQINAHPHVSGNCTRSGSGEVESEVVGVHNGIIENYTELKEKLLKHGYTFYSQTDTEVVIKLVDYYYKKYNLGRLMRLLKQWSCAWFLCPGTYVQRLSGRNLGSKKRQSNDYWGDRRRNLCSF